MFFMIKHKRITFIQPVMTNTLIRHMLDYKTKVHYYFPLTIDTLCILDDHVHPFDISFGKVMKITILI